MIAIAAKQTGGFIGRMTEKGVDSGRWYPRRLPAQAQIATSA
jgi:hypothetical protein